MLPISSPSCLASPRRPGAPKGNKNALGHGAPRGNKNGLGHGAPRGNRNALKYGVYTRAFNAPMVQPLGMSLVEALEREIHRIRLFTWEMVTSASLGNLDIQSHLALLRAVTIAVGRIERLHRSICALRTSRLLQSPLGRSIAWELALSHTAEHGLASRLPPSPAWKRQSVQGRNQPIEAWERNNCLLVPLFSREQMGSGPPSCPLEHLNWN